VKRWPALDLHVPLGEASLEEAIDAFALVLDSFSPTHSPTAYSELDAHSRGALAWRVFFASPEARDIAARALVDVEGWPGITWAPIDVEDEGWAERSQASLTAIRVGRVVVTPPWDADGAAALAREAAAEGLAPITIAIEPSMGFGTGHHESTRLCLAALQALPLDGRSVVDAGTGSGVLAIAAVRLGARHAVALDDDPDALDSASQNIALNDVRADAIEIRRASVLTDGLPVADVVLGNLTGALLRRAGDALRAAVAPGGSLIVSGFTEDERLAVAHAFEPLIVADAASEHGWLALTFRER
jgi:ribosomal protein L11 methyltransferase